MYCDFCETDNLPLGTTILKCGGCDSFRRACMSCCVETFGSIFRKDGFDYVCSICQNEDMSDVALANDDQDPMIVEDFEPVEDWKFTREVYEKSKQKTNFTDIVTMD